MATNNLGLTADLSQVIDAVNQLAAATDKLSKANEKAKKTTTPLTTEEANLAREQKLAASTTRQLADAQWRLNEIQKTGEGVTKSELRLLIEKKAQYDAHVRSIRATENAKLGLTKQTKAYNSSLGSTKAVLGQVKGLMMQTFGMYAIISGIKNTYNVIKEFEQAMARVKAITGATQEEFEQLSNIAKNMATKGSIFDPKTIAELQIELAKLGFTVREIGFATEPIVNLATATGEDLAKSAQIAAATLRSFNLDASQMTAVIDVMSKSFTTSALDMSRWAESAKYAAPVANQLGWSVQNLGALMGVLANRQIFGSMAGTALRNIMSGIADTSSDLYKSLGLTSTNFDEFIQKLSEANAKGIDFGDILKLTEKRTTTALLVLTKMTDEIKSFNDTLYNANGAVKEMAEIQLVTLAAEAAKVSAAWKAMVLSFDEGDSAFSNASKRILRLTQDMIKSVTLMGQYGAGAAFWFVEYEVKLNAALKKIEEDTKDFDNYIKTFKDDIAALTEEMNNLSEADFEGRKKKMLEIADLELRISNELKKEYLNRTKFYISEENKIKRNKEEILKIDKQIADLEEKGRVLLIQGDASFIEGEGYRKIESLKKQREELQNFIYITQDANQEFSKFADQMLSPLLEGFGTMADKEIDDLFKKVQDKITDLSKALKENQLLYSLLSPAAQITSGLEPVITEQTALLAFFEAQAGAMTRAANSRQKPPTTTEEELKKELAIRTKYLETMKAIEIASIKGDEELTEDTRKLALNATEEYFDIELLLLKNKYETDAKQKELNELLITEITREAREKRREMQQKFDEQTIQDSFKTANRLIENQKRTNAFELELLRVQLDNVKKELNALPKEDVEGKRIKMQQILDIEFEIDQKTAQNQIDNVQRKISAIYNEIEEGTSKGVDRNVILESLKISEEDIVELENQLKILFLRLGLIVKGVIPPKKENVLQKMGLDISDADLDVLSQTFSAVTSQLQNLTNSIVDSANQRVDASNTLVDQLQRDLETELALAEQGFASNVSLKRKQLEEEKKIRDQALKDQAAAQKKQLILQSALDAANLVSTVIKVALIEGATKGLAGIAAAVIGAAGLFALVGSVKAKSKAITKYERGGYEILQGKSHSQGGISLGEGREAQGGEMMSVFNKRATSKYSKEIAAFTDMLNKDKLNLNTKNILSDSAKTNVVVNMDNTKLNDVHAVLKQIRDNNTYFVGDEKIIKQGNRIRRVKRNGI